MEGVMPLLLSWQVSGTEMAKITKEQWMKGLSELQCVTWFINEDYSDAYN
jgi:hypothetical protein